VVLGDRSISYGELDAQANRMARFLRKRGARRGTSVAILMERSIDAYATMLGILKAGASYVPVDPAYPADRIAWIVDNSGVAAIVTDAQRFPQFRERILNIDELRAQIAAESASPLPLDGDSAGPRDLCYVIYTSGSTGRPKGVMIEHRNACYLVEAEQRIFEPQPSDRVYQGASLCFDLSVEEIWLTFGSGATLIAAEPRMTAGSDLATELARLEVTVLSCVPTLLSMMDPAADLPRLRLLILGGEVCAKQLVERWERPGRRIINTYGPTETTVIATWAELRSGQPVTIGRPLPGCRIRLLDDRLRPVCAGETGEICIGGAGVARGYLGLPMETGERFLSDPFSTSDPGARMFRSGDLGRLNGDGNVEFAGRADGQIKLRGFRVEPGEIEAALLRDDEVRAAACMVSENAAGDIQVVAYVVPRDGRSINERHLRARLRSWLPVWMIPSIIEIVSDLPRLPNGKLDRAALPGRRGRPKSVPALAGCGGTQAKLLEAWRALFCFEDVAIHDDFFCDLGGHSLLAARVVSSLRNDERFATLTVRDLYAHPTISRLAAEIDSRDRDHFGARARKPDRADLSHEHEDRRLHFMAGVIQTTSLYFVFAFRAIQWIAPWLIYYLVADGHSKIEACAAAGVAASAMLPLLISIAAGAKWILLGTIRPGRHRLWGGYYLRWWFVQTLIQSIPMKRMGGTPLLPFVYRLFGARIGKDVHMATDLLAAFDVISVGDGSSVDDGASLLGFSAHGGDLVIAPISIGRKCLVGTRSVLSPGSVMEDGARLEDLSMLPGDARIPAGETWTGSPARKNNSLTDASGRTQARGRSVFDRAVLTTLYAVLTMIFPLVELAAFIPGVAILTQFEPDQALFYFAAPVAGACFILCVTLEVAMLKWLLIGRAHAGTWAVHSGFYIRNWVVEQLLAFSLEIAGPLHSTLFLKPWYRLLGVKLGKFVEIATAGTTTPDLLEIDDDCTVADEVSLGAARVEGGWLTLAPTRLCRRSFVGNGAVIPGGTTLGAGTLVGVLSVAPEKEDAARIGSAWLGSPPISLPRREQRRGFSEQTTFRPGWKVQWARGCWEALRVTLPGGGFVVVTVGSLETILRLWERAGPAGALLLLPIVFAVSCFGLILAVVPVKWLVVGRYRPFERPLWSVFLWRLELVNALFEFMAVPLGLEVLRGTPLLAWYLRLLGCGIGRGVYIDSTGFLEFDLLDVGDRTVLNRDCILQTHLFEDRVMKGGRVRIGSGCEIGEHAIVLCDSEMKDGAQLGALSLVMKGEVLPAGRMWVGSPINSAREGEAGTVGAEDQRAASVVA
jgi:non-ribosomal peptide synthetase-like protein